MAIYVESLSAPTAGGGIRTFIDTESWELVTTGVDDFYKPVAEREPLIGVLQEWLADPDDAACDGRELAQLLLDRVGEEEIPADLSALVKSPISLVRSST
jgi:hypothetical protein